MCVLWWKHVGARLFNGSVPRLVVPWKASRSVRCACCDITLNSAQQARQHYAGKAHQRRLHRLQKRPPQPEAEVVTESRDREPGRETARGPTPVVDDEQVDADAGSMATMHDGDGKDRQVAAILAA